MSRSMDDRSIVDCGIIWLEYWILDDEDDMLRMVMVGVTYAYGCARRPSTPVSKCVGGGMSA